MNTHNQYGHIHCGCVHCLHYCQYCNVVYCCKCGQQWGQGYSYYYTYPQYTTTNPVLGAGTTTIGTCVGHTHA